MDTSEQKNILFLATDPTDLSRLRLGQEIRDVEEILSLSKCGNQFSLSTHFSVRLKRLNFLLRNSNPYIVHFSGHGANTGELCFEDDNGKSQSISLDLLGILFKSLSSKVHCVVLNACHSEDQARAISDHIEFVIGMNKAIGDNAAIAFSVGFYGALGAGNSIEEAYESGCVEIQIKEGMQMKSMQEYLTPVIYKREKDEEASDKKVEEDEKAHDSVQTPKFMLVLNGTIDEIDKQKVEVFLDHIKVYFKDINITLDRIEPGSVKIVFDGSPESYERIAQLIRSGQIDDVAGLSIKDISIITKDDVEELLKKTRRYQVPMMFRAQVAGRCQLQRIDPQRKKEGEEQDVERWIDEWIDKAYPDAPAFSTGVQTRSYTINWRFVTNGGQDDGIIRPVIGAQGWPFYPGSSMKGAFRSACTDEQAERYCGKKLAGGDFEPGLLRFHGGYPIDTDWQEQLVDLIHPQQERQVQREKTTSAFAQISLYQPSLQFGISSQEPLDEAEWDTIWQIWEQALSSGLGCRVSAGYGQVTGHAGDILYQGRLKGQGQAPKLLDETGEFRPNVFRAAIRGHALRLFGGLTEADRAEQLVNELFGSVRGSGDVGLLSMTFQADRVDIDSYGRDRWEQPTYKVEGNLLWMLNRPLSDENQQQALSKLVSALTRFAVIFGGFGKSWRRADHRLFYPDYAEQDYKPLIGCHWQWMGEESLLNDVKVRKLENIPLFLKEVRQTATNWIQLQNAKSNGWASDWREAWHPDKVQVWGRTANEAEACVAVHWLHGPYRDAIPSARISEGSIYRSSLTGQMGQIGRLWHRMYPIVKLVRRANDPEGKPIPKETPQFIELLTLFPDDSWESEQFLRFLETEQSIFQKLWPS